MNLVIIQRWHKWKRNYARVGRLFIPSSASWKPEKSNLQHCQTKGDLLQLQHDKYDLGHILCGKVFRFFSLNLLMDGFCSVVSSFSEFVKVCCVASGAASSPADSSVPSRTQNLILKHPYRKVQKLLCWSCKQQQQNTTDALSSRSRILLTHYVILRAYS